MSLVRVGAEVSGRVCSAHPVGVGRRGREAAVRVAQGGGGRDLREVRAARALAALDPVGDDADVVRGCPPGEIDLGRARGRRGQVPGRARRGGVGRRRSSHRARPEVVGAAGRPAQADTCVAGAAVGRVRDDPDPRPGSVLAPGLEHLPLDAQEQEVAGDELLVDREQGDDGAVVDPLERDLVGP